MALPLHCCTSSISALLHFICPAALDSALLHFVFICTAAVHLDCLHFISPPALHLHYCILRALLHFVICTLPAPCSLDLAARTPCPARVALHKSLSLSSSATFRIFHCIPVVRIPAVCVLRFPRCVAFCTLPSAHSYACVLRPLALSCAYHSCTFLRSPALF